MIQKVVRKSQQDSLKLFQNDSQNESMGPKWGQHDPPNEPDGAKMMPKLSKWAQNGWEGVFKRGKGTKGRQKGGLRPGLLTLLGVKTRSNGVKMVKMG